MGSKRTMGLVATMVLAMGCVAEPTIPNAPSPSAEATRPTADAKLTRRIEELVRAAGLGKGRVSVSIRACDGDAGPGPEIVAIEADRPRIPASNMKLISTGAALHELGPGFEFKTRVVRRGDTFIVVGDGDPAFGDPAFFEDLVFRDADGQQRRLDEEMLLGFWADAIATAANGEPIRLEVDDSIFERVFWHDGWNPDDRLRRFAAEVAGLNFHRNTFHFRPDAGSGRSRPDWSDMRPLARARLADSGNDSSRGGAGDAQTAWISRAPEANDLTFKGVVKGRHPATAPPLEVTFHDPPLMMLELLAERLADRGVRVLSIGRSDAPPPADAPSVGPLIRTPILPLIERCNESSQNLYAEALLKRTVRSRTGEQGSWERADQVVKAIAEDRLGPAAASLLEGVTISDGSGLSRGNRVTAGLLTAWLDAFDDDRALREVFIESLSRGGDPDDGTLSKRFRTFPAGCRIDGKSGYISGVSALSGFVTVPDGRRWSFSVICNNVAHDVRGAMNLQERIATAIALHGMDS